MVAAAKEVGEDVGAVAIPDVDHTSHQIDGLLSRHKKGKHTSRAGSRTKIAHQKGAYSKWSLKV